MLLRWCCALLLSLPAWGCSCVGWPSAKDAWETSPLVFLSAVEKQIHRPLIPLTFTGSRLPGCEFSEAYRGTRLTKSCSSRPATAHRSSRKVDATLHPTTAEGVWEAPGCHRSRSMAQAADDLLFLRALPASERGNRLSGTVELYENSLEEGFRRSRAPGGVKITITGEAGALTTLTNADGAYELYGLTPGTYKIDISIPDHLTLRFPIVQGRANGARRPDQIVVDRSSGTSVDFVLMADNGMAGQVFDPGAPL